MGAARGMDGGAEMYDLVIKQGEIAGFAGEVGGLPQVCRAFRGACEGFWRSGNRGSNMPALPLLAAIIRQHKPVNPP